MPESGVRLARTSDVDQIAGVNVRSWRQRFADVLPRDLLDGLDDSDLALVWASGILNPPTPLHRLLVAVDGSDVVGYAALGPAQDADSEGASAELLALEVDPGRQRQGHGSRLMAASVDHARSAAVDTVVTWCAATDEPRRDFLQSAGWGPDGAFRDLLVAVGEDGSHQTVREVRLVTGIG